MNTITLACYTIRDEIMLVVDDLRVNCPILWIDSGLHNFPEKLNKAIQEQINRIENVQNILLLFGSCGNSLAGLYSSNARIIFPKVDDCISLFLGGNERRRMLDKQDPSYYLTKGYLKNETNILTEFTYCKNRYGKEKAKTIFKKMLNNYRKLRVIDTGAYDPNEIAEETNTMADEFDLIHEIVEGSLEIIYKAFRGEWDEDFVIVEPGQTISYNDLGIG